MILSHFKLREYLNRIVPEMVEGTNIKLLSFEGETLFYPARGVSGGLAMKFIVYLVSELSYDKHTSFGIGFVPTKFDSFEEFDEKHVKLAVLDAVEEFKRLIKLNQSYIFSMNGGDLGPDRVTIKI